MRLVGLAGVLVLSGLLWSAEALAGAYGEGHAAFEAGEFADAKEIWRPLAEEGDVRAQYGLGVLYERGPDGVRRNYAAAARWYAEAARQGHPGAQNNLGLLHAQGRGVDIDPRRAAELWGLAAEAGHLVAQYNLGLAYYRGEGLARDNDAALRWFRSAARGGLADGKYAIAQMYRLGVVVEEDEATALAWYERAADIGHEDAAARARALRDEGVSPAPLDVAEAHEPEDGEALAARDPEPGEREPAQSDIAEAEPGEPEPSAPEAAEPDSAEPAPAEPETTEPETAEPETAEADSTDPANADGEGTVRVWLGSLRSPEAAEQHWSDMRARHPDALAEADARHSRVEVEDQGTFYRVLAGPYPDEASAEAVCEAMRERDDEAFCQPMTDAR